MDKLSFEPLSIITPPLCDTPVEQVVVKHLVEDTLAALFEESGAGVTRYVLQPTTFWDLSREFIAKNLLVTMLSFFLLATCSELVLYSCCEPTVLGGIRPCCALCRSQGSVLSLSEVSSTSTLSGSKQTCHRKRFLWHFLESVRPMWRQNICCQCVTAHFRHNSR